MKHLPFHRFHVQAFFLILYFLTFFAFEFIEKYQSVLFLFNALYSTNNKFANYSTYKFINITYSTDSKYDLYTIVSITSLMEHSTNKSLWYNIYILVLPNFSPLAKQRLMGLSRKYDRLTVNIIVVYNNFKNFNRPGTKILRLKLPELLPDVNRIIHLDVDTCVLKDLDQFYDLNMSNLMIRGILDYDLFREMKKFGVEDESHYINSGVILMNLEEMRKEHSVDIVQKFIDNHGSNLILNDQPIINILFYKKIGLLPLQFGFHNRYCSENKYHKFFRASYYYKYYTMEEVHKIIYNLTVVHFMFKPWECQSYSFLSIKFWMCRARPPYIREWGQIALKTGYAKALFNTCPWLRFIDSFDSWFHVNPFLFMY